jgi:CRP/FNR family transcriptional regulator, cyclic AMP receptor protein
MTASNLGFLQPELGRNNAVSAEFDESLSRQAAVSTALTSVFRGRFCDLVLPNRKTTTFRKDQVIYEVGDAERTLLFIKNGFVRVGTITPSGQEVIYDVRKCGDVVGELCASEPLRPDRAVALEHTDAISVPFEEFVDLLLINPELIRVLVDVFCRSLKEAYAQVNALAADDIAHRLVKVLIGLATKLGRQASSLVEIPIYLTQEEIAQMVAARRERISTVLNSLRRRGMVRYTTRGHLMIDLGALRLHSA